MFHLLNTERTFRLNLVSQYFVKKKQINKFVYYSSSSSKKAIFACSSPPYNLGCSCERRLPAVRPSFWWSSRWSFGVGSGVPYKCDEPLFCLLTCSFRAFLLLLTNFTTSCKSHRSRMSLLFIQSNPVLSCPCNSFYRIYLQ